MARAFNRLGRHLMTRAVAPAIHATSRRLHVQFRPDRYASRHAHLESLIQEWDSGPRANNRGDHARLHFLATNIEALNAAGTFGAMAELGVYRGHSARILRLLAPDRELFLFDTFDGLPDSHTAGDPSGIAGGSYRATEDAVRAFVGEGDGIHYCRGLFPATARMVPRHTRFALVHLDCDLYVPTLKGLEFFYPRLVPGGLLILHDYASGCFPGVTKAADEFLADKPEGLICIPDKSGSAALVKDRRQASTVEDQV